MRTLFKLKFSLVISFTVLASGCSIFPDYLKPNIKAPEVWQAKQVGQTKLTKNPDNRLPHSGQVDQLIGWWKQFNDPVLTRLLQAAETNSPTLDKAIANIKSARANTVAASAQGLPTLTGNISASRASGSSVSGNVGTNVSGGSTSSLSTTKTGNLDAAWELDLFGGIKFSKQAADARLQAKENDWHTARVSLAAEVATSYLDYRACLLSVAAYQQALNSKQEATRLTNILAGAGFSSPADTALAEASLRATESSLIGQQAQCDGTVKSLVALTNLPEPSLRSLLASANNLPQPAEFTIDSLPAQLITQRPDLAADERNLAAANADIGVATANRYPSVSLTGSIGRTNISSNGFSSSSNTWSFGPSISLPIFDGGKLKSQVSIAEANYAIAYATYEQDVRTAIKEVEQALVSLDSAARREATEKISTEQYRKYYKAAEINWRAGGISLITLEDARRQLINAELSHITQQHDRVQYWIALYKALGGGWQTNAGVNTAIVNSETSLATAEKSVSFSKTNVKKSSLNSNSQESTK